MARIFPFEFVSFTQFTHTCERTTCTPSCLVSGMISIECRESERSCPNSNVNTATIYVTVCWSLFIMLPKLVKCVLSVSLGKCPKPPTRPRKRKVRCRCRRHKARCRCCLKLNRTRRGNCNYFSSFVPCLSFSK